MQNTILTNNKVLISGKLDSNFTYSHQLFGETFYQTTLKIKRLSGCQDFIPVIVSDKLIDVTQKNAGRFLTIHGQFHSHNYYENGRTHLKLYIFAQEIQMLEEKDAHYENKIFLDGYLCRPPVYRLTPLKREIADFLLAVNRSYGKSDYIPGICWSDNAQEIATYPVGTRVTLSGRIQSREYVKKMDDGHPIRKIAYEISVSNITRREFRRIKRI